MEGTTSHSLFPSHMSCEQGSPEKSSSLQLASPETLPTAGGGGGGIALVIWSNAEEGLTLSSPIRAQLSPLISVADTTHGCPNLCSARAPG